MNERDQLIRLCTKLGAATPAMAATMADQLLKRSEQLVVQRGWSKVEAMNHLLQLVTKGARGEAPPGFEGVAKAPRPQEHV